MRTVTGVIDAGSQGLLVAPDDPRSRRRMEDERFLTGRGRYVDDVPATGHLFLAVHRSPHAHADILAIDTRDADSMPGVRGIYTGRDLLADDIGTLPCLMNIPSLERPLVVPKHYPLAVDRVRHVGDAVAFVVADTPEQARDAAEMIAVDYDIRDSVTDLAHALDPDAPQIWEEAPGNLAFHYRKGDFAAGEKALAEAAHVVECELVNNRIVAAAIEPRVAIGYWDEAADRYRLEASVAGVHALRFELAEHVMRVPSDRVDVVCPDVGGGFGMKNIVYPEYAMLLWAAKRHRQPVRWMAERVEEFTSGVHGRDNITRARLALDTDGRITCLWAETIANLGAYVSSLGPSASTTAPTPAMGGLYQVPIIVMDVRGAFTNTAPVDAYRGAGKPEANYIIERMIDVAARRIGMDPIALRRRNFISQFPYRNANGALIDSGTFADNLERALRLADHAGFAARKAEAASRGKRRGFGVACFLETARGLPGEDAWLRIAPDGRIDAAVGTQSNGQGHETSFAQLVADRLGIPVEQVRLVQGDTRTVPSGGGHGGARSLHMGGTALVLAVDAFIDKAKEAAARLLQTTPDQVSYANGVFSCPGDAAGLERHIDIAGMAAALPRQGDGPLLEAHARNPSDLVTFPNGCHIAEVEVDPETGEVKIIRYLAVDDYGRLLNPLLTEGQLQGGIAQGIGQALMEASVYDSETGQLISASFTDYAMPRCDDLPNFDIFFAEVPTASNPIGAKGVGQAGCIAAPQTIINAVVDALADLGIDTIDMPATPQRVWQAIRQAEAARAHV